MRGFTDIHHHIVYGLDDGAQTASDALNMLRAAYKDGSRVVLGTTHISPGVQRFDTETYYARVREMGETCRAEGIALTLLPGSEIFYTDATCRFLREGRVPTLAGTDYVLVEFNPNVRYETVAGAVEGVLREGYLPVLAHMERYECLAKDIRRCVRLKDEMDVLFQMNCSSVIGGRGFFRDREARRLLDEGLIDAVASDAHNVERRPTRMRHAYRTLLERYGEETAQRLMGCTDDGAFWRAIRDAVEKARGPARRRPVQPDAGLSEPDMEA